MQNNTTAENRTRELICQGTATTASERRTCDLHCCCPGCSILDLTVGNTDTVVPANRMLLPLTPERNLHCPCFLVSLVSNSKSQMSASDWQSLSQRPTTLLAEELEYQVHFNFSFGRQGISQIQREFTCRTSIITSIHYAYNALSKCHRS